VARNLQAKNQLVKVKNLLEKMQLVKNQLVRSMLVKKLLEKHRLVRSMLEKKLLEKNILVKVVRLEEKGRQLDGAGERGECTDSKLGKFNETWRKSFWMEMYACCMIVNLLKASKRKGPLNAVTMHSV
jgi:hypothetical protein